MTSTRNLTPSKRKQRSACEDDVDSKDDPKFKLWYSEQGDGDKAPYSDYTLVVESSSRKRTFNVHSLVLSSCSEYFSALFEAGYKESATDRSVFHFPEIAVNHFELILDYAYTTDYLGTNELQDVSTTDFCVLLYLSDYFQMNNLRNACKDILQDWRNDDIQHCYFPCEFVECYQQMHLPQIREFLLEWGACKMASVYVDKGTIDMEFYLAKQDRFFGILDAQMFLEILSHQKREKHHKAWTSCVADFCQEHRDDAAMILMEVAQHKLLSDFWNEGAFTLLQTLLATFSDDTLQETFHLTALQEDCANGSIFILIFKKTLLEFDNLITTGILQTRFVTALLRNEKCNYVFQGTQMEKHKLMDDLRKILRSLKRMHGMTVPMYVSGCPDARVNGKYYSLFGKYSKEGTDDFVLRRNFQEQKWTIKEAEDGQELYFCEDDESSTPPVPLPASGWICSRTGAEITSLTIDY